MEISQIPKNEKSKDQGDTMAKRLRNRRVIDIKKSLNQAKLSSEAQKYNNNDDGEAIFSCVKRKLVGFDGNKKSLGELVSTELPTMIDEMLGEIDSKSSVKDSQILGFLDIIEGMVIKRVKEDEQESKDKKQQNLKIKTKSKK